MNYINIITRYTYCCCCKITMKDIVINYNEKREKKTQISNTYFD